MSDMLTPWKQTSSQWTSDSLLIYGPAVKTQSFPLHPVQERRSIDAICQFPFLLAYNCGEQVPLEQCTYACPACGSLLEVHIEPDWFTSKSAEAWKTLFDSRLAGQPGPDGSGVRRFREWVLPDLPKSISSRLERVALH